MDFFEQYERSLSAEERSILLRAQGFCASEFSNEVRRAYERNEPFERQFIRQWADLGILALQVKREHGGHDASFSCKVRIAQEMARYSFAAAFAANNLQGQVTRVSRQGSPALVEKVLAPMMKGEYLSAVAMTESAGGSDLAALAASASPADGGWLLNGTKAWVTNGLIITHANVLARVKGHEGDAIASFVVPLNEEAGTLARTEHFVPGARSFRLAQIEFRNHFVPSWSMLAAPGGAFKTAMSSVNAARVHVAAMCVASLHTGLMEAVDYCHARSAFGKPLVQHQGLRWELAEVATRLEAANALVYRAVEQIQAGKPAVTIAAQAKKFAVDTSIWGLDQCVRIVGAIGTTPSMRSRQLLDEVRMGAFGDGTNQMLLDRVGRGLLAAYGSEP